MNLPQIKVGNKLTTFPVIQGGMAVRISLAPLAASVANAGGIGIIGGSGINANELAHHIDEAKNATKGIIGVNLMVALHEFCELVQTSIKKKVDLIISGAGISRDLFKWTKNKIPVFPIVSSSKLALSLAKLGASGIIVESGKAGGHLGTDPDKSIWEILPKVVAILRENGFSKIPVIAAGGILKGKDISRAIDSGATGVQIGTRFALTDECSAHDNWKKVLLEAKDEDAVIIESPVGLHGRAVKTPLVEKILIKNAPPPGTYRRCQLCLKHCGREYCIIDALEKAQQGNIEEGLFFCGARVGEINEICSVDILFKNLKEEFGKAQKNNSFEKMSLIEP